MSGSLLCLLVREVPHCVLERVLFSTHRSNLGQDSNFEATHREQELGAILGVHTDERVFPFDGGKGPRQTLFDIPEDGPPQVDVVLDQPHTAIPWPTAFVVVSDNVIVSGVGVGTEVPLNKVSRFIGSEAEQDV